MFNHSLQYLVASILLVAGSNAVAVSDFDVVILVNDTGVNRKLQFSRENYFAATVPFDFAAAEINSVRSLKVSSTEVPARFLTVRSDVYANELYVVLDYPDPRHRALAMDSIGLFEMELFLDNESPAVNRVILASLGANQRLALLGRVGAALEEAQMARYEDSLIAAVIHCGLTANRGTAEKLLGSFISATDEKLEIGRMVLGFSDPQSIIAMQSIVSQNKNLQRFAKEVVQQVGANDIIAYLLAPTMAIK